MTFQVNPNTIRFNATAIGIVDYLVASAYTGCTTPENSNVTNGKVYRYYAQSPDGTQWEYGSGAYSTITHTLARTTVSSTSNGDQNLVNFATVPVVDVYPSPAPTLEPPTDIDIPLPGAWTAWNPTVIPDAGAFTTVSAAGAYVVFGKTIHYAVTITITNIGSATGAMTIAVPTGTIKRATNALVTETAVVGNMGFGRLAATGTFIFSILKYDNTTYISNGNVVTVSGTYEQQ